MGLCDQISAKLDDRHSNNGETPAVTFLGDLSNMKKKKKNTLKFNMGVIGKSYDVAYLKNILNHRVKRTNYWNSGCCKGYIG